MDHAALPSVNDATLPATYENAKKALAECSNLDECKDWSDKAMALASYARQAKDDAMRKMADRIKARAIRRAGELLKQIQPGKGGRPVETSGAGDISLTRKQAATDAGLSERQRNNALRVAEVGETEFNEMVDSENPPTIKKLAEIGTKKKVIDLKGRDPKEFNKAMHFVGLFDDHLRRCNKYNIGDTVAILTDGERDKLRKIISQIDAIHDQIITRI